MVILVPELSEKDTNNELNEIRSMITTPGGKIVNEDVWGLRDLAYTIKKHDRGFYTVINFELAPEHIKEIEKALTIQPAVIRSLIIKTPKYYEFKTLQEYQDVADALEKEQQKEREEKEAARRPAGRPAAPAAPRKAPAAVAPKREPKAVSEEKIKNIVNDPDISL